MKWIDRSVFVSPFCIGLCLSEKDFHAALKKLGIDRRYWPDWISPGAHATTHHLERSSGDPHAVIVCIRKDRKHTRIEHYALLVHEAVHVWQAICRYAREDEPSSEFEAYSIQNISQDLMAAFDAG